MAIPASPANFYAQTGNGQVYLSWSLTAGATAYDVQRSLDGVTYASILPQPPTPYYLDTTVTVGTQYYYKVASVNSSGTSTYTAPQAVVPASTGEMCLGQLRLAAQQRADRVNSQFVTLPEWNSYINQSMFELYDLLVNTYEDYFVASPLSFQTDGVNSQYVLPNGTNYSKAPAFYRLIGVDLALNTAANAYVSVERFNFIDRNRYLYPNSNSTIYGAYNLQYRLVGNTLDFIPTPTANQTIRIWYVPRLTELLSDNDLTSTGISGWLEYVITDAAIKALQKEESDVSILALQKSELIKRIQSSAMNRDIGQPSTISDTRNATGNPWGGFNGPGGW